MGMTEQSQSKVQDAAEKMRQIHRGNVEQRSEGSSKKREKSSERSWGTGPDDPRNVREAMQEAEDRFKQDYDI